MPTVLCAEGEKTIGTARVPGESGPTEPAPEMSIMSGMCHRPDIYGRVLAAVGSVIDERKELLT
jgi:hypothetical protein